MNLPKKIKIGPFTYRFKKTAEDYMDAAYKYNDTLARGFTDCDTCTFYLHPDLETPAEIEVSLHEAFHAIYYTMGLHETIGHKKEETIVGAMATGALMLIRDNHKFIQYLQQKEDSDS